MTYQIQLRPQAVRAIRALEHQDAARIRGAIALLATDPRPPGSRRLSVRPGFRVRVGNYRIVYTIDDGILLVVVVTLGHRKDVYRQQ
jgi:mRNA interferase RelE/StbE